MAENNSAFTTTLQIEVSLFFIESLCIYWIRLGVFMNEIGQIQLTQLLCTYSDIVFKLFILGL